MTFSTYVVFIIHVYSTLVIIGLESLGMWVDAVASSACDVLAAIRTVALDADIAVRMTGLA